MDYYQVRKNYTEVIRIDRGPYKNRDVTRLQVWYKKDDGNEYLPGHTVAFASEIIPAIVEGLANMSLTTPIVNVPCLKVAELSKSSRDLAVLLEQILRTHKEALHYENIHAILCKEKPKLGASKWCVYNVLLSNPDRFDQIDEDVFKYISHKKSLKQS